MKEVNAFGCEYCGMTSRNKYSVRRHELYWCRKNPNRKACRNCSNLNPDHCEDGYYCDEIEDYICHPLNADMSDCVFYIKYLPDQVEVEK